MIVDKIQNYLDSEGKEIDRALLEEVSILSAWAFERQFGKRISSSPSIRLSSSGRCVRQQAYSYLDYPKAGKDIDARAKMVFFQGDLVEMAVISLMKASGLTIMHSGRDQIKIEFEGVEGHPDGVFVASEKEFLFEVKSMSSYSFSDFQKGIIDDGYRYQINAYLEAMNLDQCVMVGLNKDAGVLDEKIVSKDEEIVKDIKQRISIIRAATKENLPLRPFTANAKGVYPWQCRYCAYYTHCLPNAKLVLEKSKYILTEAK